MGAGKTSLGMELAARLRRVFLDMDEAISTRLSMSIPEAFDQMGEKAFRDAESAELKRLSRRKGLVVATGGGVVEREENRRLMKASGVILHLAASLENCRSHLDPAQTAGRPLWKDSGALETLYENRQAYYADNDLSVSSDGKVLRDVAGEAMAQLLDDERYIVLLDGKECPVIATSRAPELLEEFTGDRNTALLSDSNLAKLQLDRYRKALPDAVEILVPAGENSKSLRNAEKVYQALLHSHLERNDMLVALGGGVVTDLGAFVAATYKRGIDFVLCSTSLVGCVDAAIGGKAAVNLAGAKNQVGCFTRPLAVILDLASLATLPRRAIVEGLVEAYKTGLAADPALARLMEDNLTQLMKGDVLGLAQVVKMAAQAKVAVVSEDFRESGKRRILNLGHTYGHALESHNRYRVGHGRSVAAGMRVAVELSRSRGLLESADAHRMQIVLKKLAKGKMNWPPAGDAWPVMLNDKKNVGGKVIFVLLSGPGEPVITDDLTPEELQVALDRLASDGSN
jgi:shikimate kinase/3-dehydroquinate synthase